MSRPALHKLYHPFTLLLLLLALLATTEHLVRTATPPSPAHISGRWPAVRASLGLPTLPVHAHFPVALSHHLHRAPPRAARFDLRRKRSLSSDVSLPQLYLAADARPAVSAPLDELLASYRAIALLEKDEAGAKARTGKGKKNAAASAGRRHPLSWTTPQRKQR